MRFQPERPARVKYARPVSISTAALQRFAMLEISTEVMCPHCGETITLFVDLSVESQTYIEDCSVCCQPMEISYTAADGELTDIHVDAAS